MSEPTPVTETVAYRPISGLAVGGLVLSALFSIWLGVAATVALRSGTPLLIEPAWLLVPVAGAVISGLGWLQVHRSEGSRLGARPAKYGVLLGVLATLCYGAWYAMTELPLRLQARDFTNVWFDDLRQSAEDERVGLVAFWCTIHPRRRDASFGDLSNPDEREALLKAPKKFEAFQEPLRNRHLTGEPGKKGELPVFFQNEVVRLVQQAGTKAEVEPLGVRDWSYVGGSEPGYRVEQSYRIRTPDGVYEITVPVLSLDADRRRWRVLLYETIVSQREPTPRGRFVNQLREDSHRFATDWVKKLNDGKREDVFLETRPARDRESLRRNGALSLLADGLSAGSSMPPAGLLILSGPLADRDVAASMSLPGYAGVAAGAAVDGDWKMAGRKHLQKLVQEMKALLQPSGTKEILLQLTPTGPGSYGPYEVTTGALMPNEVIIYHPFTARIGMKYICEGLIAVASSDQKLLAGMESTAGAELPEGTTAQRNRRWRVVGLRVQWGGELPPMRK